MLYLLVACNASNYLLHTKVKTCATEQNACTPCTQTSILLYLLTYLPCYVLGKLFTHVHHISVCIIVFIVKECLRLYENRQNAFIHTWTSIVPYLLVTWNASNYLLHTKVKTVSLNKLFARRHRFCFTYLLTYLLTYLFTYLHTHHVMYWASYSLMFIALVCG